MARNTEDPRSKHGKQNAKHLEAVVLQEKWLEENAVHSEAELETKNEKQCTFSIINQKTLIN